MKNQQCPGEYNITVEMIKLGGDRTTHCYSLQQIFIRRTYTKMWHEEEVILILKNGDSNIEKYRPISLLTQLYKLFARAITNSLTPKT